MNPAGEPAAPLFASHPRAYAQNRYVYPVVSRRAKGISLGVNLNLDKVCNFDCVYCQVDRRETGVRDFVELPRLVAELDATVELVTSGRIFREPPFSETPAALRRLNDIAFSGDGEPTTFRNFPEVVQAAADVRRRHGLESLALVLITNASMFHRPQVQRGLEILDANRGEIWAKLDAGTEAYYQSIARSAISLSRILENLALAARVRPIVIQSLFLRIRGEGPPQPEQQAYCERLAELIEAGGQIKLVQIHTIARPPAESWVSALAAEELQGLAARVRARTGLRVEVF